MYRTVRKSRNLPVPVVPIHSQTFARHLFKTANPENLKTIALLRFRRESRIANREWKLEIIHDYQPHHDQAIHIYKDYI
jgi:hypothetical protein